jgi:hypothetical protein
MEKVLVSLSGNNINQYVLVIMMTILSNSQAYSQNRNILTTQEELFNDNVPYIKTNTI